MNVKVVGKESLADGVVRLVLRHSYGGDFPEWRPGAHVDLALSEDLVRQYSLCGDPANRDVLEVAVLREPQSRGGSAHVHDELQEGDRIRVRGPRNHFALTEARNYLFIAGGIGITPILPMIRAVAGDGVPWRLLYGGRSRSSMAFLDELERYGERVRICPQDETGLLDLDSALGSPAEDTAVYCCGPEALLEAVEKRCASWPAGSLHVERFTPRAIDESASSESFEIELASTGEVLTVPPDKTIVDVLEEAGVDVEVSCLEGTCGTCETAVLGGTPEHRDSILTEEERAAGDTMFLCVSRSSSPRLRIDR
ncbi:oxidoreductase [Amycolatopsis sp. K13G38]|uniref:Oxidoreductase n=1 Tax=Amycolatopsis acididurans TaxID=2724524 RepID=A0ABX1J2K7_9PSEU|nr:PDR/VanB family oxidoreductase [Amycolatopsis acididurans]NKQ53199.1 oxidoreductase [Amycolatopsis acididurans]